MLLHSPRCSFYLIIYTLNEGYTLQIQDLYTSTLLHFLHRHHYTCLHLSTLVYTFLNLFTLVYICLHLSTLVYTCLHLSILVYTCLHLFTLVYTCLHLFTLVYTCLHLSTLVYTCLHLFTLVYTCLHLSTFSYTYLHLATLIYPIVLEHHVTKPYETKIFDSYLHFKKSSRRKQSKQAVEASTPWKHQKKKIVKRHQGKKIVNRHYTPWNHLKIGKQQQQIWETQRFGYRMNTNKYK